MKIAIYKVKLKNDDSIINVTTTATSLQQAIKQVCDYENAPLKSVIEAKLIKVIHENELLAG